MKIECKLFNIGYDFKNKSTKIELIAEGDILSNLEPYMDKKLNVELKEWRATRTLDANAYFHVLLQELANHYGTSLEEMKVIENLKYGSVARNVDGTKVGIKVPFGTDIKSFYPYARKFGECVENDITFEKYLLYKETHTLNTKEMATLIEGVVQDCKDAGIETRQDVEIKDLLKERDINGTTN